MTGKEMAPGDLAALLRAKEERDTASARARARFAQTLALFAVKYGQAGVAAALGLPRQEVHRLIRDYAAPDQRGSRTAL
jgi:hypothetical protein